MSEILSAAIEKITAQQPKERTAVWMVGEQLKDMLRAEPQFAEIVLQDLENESMSITHCEKQIKAYADKHRKGNSSCTPPVEAERIIREFYGLSDAPAAVAAPVGSGSAKIVNLADFW